MLEKYLKAFINDHVLMHLKYIYPIFKSDVLIKLYSDNISTL